MDVYRIALPLLLTAAICHSSELPGRKLLQARPSCILHICQQVKLLCKHSAVAACIQPDVGYKGQGPNMPPPVPPIIGKAIASNESN